MENRRHTLVIVVKHLGCSKRVVADFADSLANIVKREDHLELVSSYFLELLPQGLKFELIFKVKSASSTVLKSSLQKINFAVMDELERAGLQLAPSQVMKVDDGRLFKS